MATTVLASIGDHGALNAALPTDLQAVWIDRDLSWLDFNERVLAEALDERTPLLERAKFLAIFTSNLDEFFMKREAVLRHGTTDAQRALLAASPGQDPDLTAAPGGVLPANHHPRPCPARSVSALAGTSSLPVNRRREASISNPSCRLRSRRWSSTPSILFLFSPTCRPHWSSGCAMWPGTNRCLPG